MPRNPYSQLQPCSDTQTQCSNYHRQSIHHVRKKRIKHSFLKLHQLVQHPSSHSLPYKDVSALYHTQKKKNKKLSHSYFPLFKRDESLDSAFWPAKAKTELRLSFLLLTPKLKPKAHECREAIGILNCLGLLDIYHSDLSYTFSSSSETGWRTKRFIMLSQMTRKQNLISQGRRLFLLQLFKKQFGSFSTC